LLAAARGNAAQARKLGLTVTACLAVLAIALTDGSAAAGAGHGAAPVGRSPGRALQSGTLTISTESEDGLNGAGSATVKPPGATCAPNSVCTFPYDEGDSKTLTAAASPGSFFYRWKVTQDSRTIACAGSDFETPCTLHLAGAETHVAATFLPNPTLAVGVTGTEAAVTVTPGGEQPRCETSQNGSEACYYSAAPGSTVTLTPTDVQGSTFVGWSVPECPGRGQCNVVVDSQLRTVVATYSPIHLTVLVERGTGNGTVTSGPHGPINCPPPDTTCEADIEAPPFAEVNLTASTSGVFNGWNGACLEAGKSPTCKIRLSGDDVVGAWFDDAPNPPEIIPPRIPIMLQVKKTGDGQGTVSSNRSSTTSEKISCGSGRGCGALFEQGETANLVADASAGSTFAGWKTPADECSASLTCRFEVTRVSRLEATFKRKQAPPPPPPVPGACKHRLEGTARGDRLDGTPGGDRILGRGGNDRIRGFGGNDCLYGGPGKDTLKGGNGNDLLNGGPGKDVLNGGRGRDQIVAVDGRRDRISCGPGRDVARADRIDRVSRDCERSIRK
jgi:RTX calcium-binding nonapeptide repeat (4 copies)/Divergent InlB B-repeat domain